MEEKEANINFGKAIAEICDICVVVNEANSKEIIEGIQSQENSKTQIIQALNLDDAKIKINEFIEKGCCILFENDFLHPRRFCFSAGRGYDPSRP